METSINYDMLGLERLLSEDERQIRDSVNAFVNSEILPITKEHFRDATFPDHIINKMAELGIFGAHIEGYECAGVSPVGYGLIMQELEKGDSSIRSFASVQSSLAMTAIWLHGSEEQKKYWLPLMASGKVIGAFALTEPDHGSDPGGMSTYALPKNDGWVLNGEKFWITNASKAHVIIVWAKSPDGIKAFILESPVKGLTVGEIKNKLSLRMSSTGSLSFDNIQLGKESLLEKTKGLSSALECLNHARFGIAWGVMGAAHACLHEALNYTKNRVQFSKPIAAYQLVQAKLADMFTELSIGQLLAYQIADNKKAGTLHHSQISIAKYRNTQAALDIARTCRDLLGASGVLDDFVTIRHMLNLEAVNTYEGTRHMHQLAIGKHVTGISAFDG